MIIFEEYMGIVCLNTNPLGVINQNLLIIDFFAGNLYSIRTKMSV